MQLPTLQIDAPGRAATRGAPDAAVPCTVRETRIPVAAARPPEALLAQLKAHGVAGAALFHTRGATLVALRPLLRITLRGACVRVAALEAAARPLLERLVGIARRAGPEAGASGDDALELAVQDELPRPGEPDETQLARASCLDPLRRAASLLADRAPGSAVEPFVVGHLAYDLVDRFERIGSRPPAPFDEPDLHFVLAGDAVRYGPDGSATLVTRGLPWERRRDVEARHAAACELLAGRDALERARLPALPRRAPARPLRESPPERFLAGVAAVQRAIAAGDLFQAVLSRGATFECTAAAARVAAAFARLEPANHRFALDLEDGALVGASPELCVRVAAGVVEIHPIAGTAPRARRQDGSLDADADARAVAALLASPKERAEHAMLVDLARNDVARVCRPGTTTVEQPFALASQRHVHHLVSRVRGELRAGLDALHVARAVANMGTLTGAPKVRAMQVVRELEGTARGAWGGSVALLTASGRFESAIAIRCVRLRGRCALARSGAGIVRASRPELELAETRAKLRGVAEALALAEDAP